jgi:hypothetical protein
MNQLDERQLEQHVPILGWLHIIASALFLLLGAVGFVFLAGIGVLSGEAEAARILTFIAIVGALLFIVLGLPGILAGIGLLRRKGWGRILALVVGFFNLFNVPIGTALGAYTFFVLLQDAAAGYFAALPAD